MPNVALFTPLSSRDQSAEECGLSACLDVHHYASGNGRAKYKRRNACAAGGWCDVSHLCSGGWTEVKVRSEGNWCSRFWLCRMETTF